MKKIGKYYNWYEADGDNTLALDWPIDKDSIVFEIGGYEGRWALQMAEKYNPRMFIFEPQDWARDRCAEKLRGYNATIYPFGLWVYEAYLPLGDFGRDGASLLKPNHKDVTTVLVKDIFGFILEHLEKDEEIDVCLMNIEGAEWALVPYMIGLGIMDRIKYFWMQFHTFVPYAFDKKDILFNNIQKTHDLYWDSSPTAICWRRK